MSLDTILDFDQHHIEGEWCEENSNEMLNYNVEKWQYVRLIVIHIDSFRVIIVGFTHVGCDRRSYSIYWHWILLLKLLRFITFVSPFGVPSNVVVDMFKNVCSVFGRRFYFWWMVVVFCCCKFFLNGTRTIYIRESEKKNCSFQYFGRIFF